MFSFTNIFYDHQHHIAQHSRTIQAASISSGKIIAGIPLVVVLLWSNYGTICIEAIKTKDCIAMHAASSPQEVSQLLPILQIL
jgi:hypothetical protein